GTSSDVTDGRALAREFLEQQRLLGGNPVILPDGSTTKADQPGRPPILPLPASPTAPPAAACSRTTPSRKRSPSTPSRQPGRAALHLQRGQGSGARETRAAIRRDRRVRALPVPPDRDRAAEGDPRDGRDGRADPAQHQTVAGGAAEPGAPIPRYSLDRDLSSGCPASQPELEETDLG